MANDDNNKGLSPEEIEFQEQISEETTPESMTRALRRRVSMLENPSTRERQRRLEQERHEQSIADLDAQRQAGRLSDDQRKDLRRHTAAATKIQKEFAPGGYWEHYRSERADADLLKSTQTFVGKRSTDEQIYRASRSVSSLGAITREAGTRTSTQLEKDITAERGRLTEQQEVIRQMASGGIKTPEENEAYRQAGIHHQESINRLGVLTGAQTRQSRQKTDLAGRQRSAESLVAQVGKDSLKRKVADEIASGNVGSMAEETLNLESIQDKIAVAAEKFKDALKIGGDAAEDLGKDFEDLSEDYHRQKEKMAQMASGGGGSLSARQKVALFSGTAADVLQAGATGLMELGVNQELRDVANKTGFAAISNRQFQDHQAALSGDMAAFRRMDTDQYGKAAYQAGTLGEMAAVSKGMSAAADTAAIVAKVAEKGTNFTSALEAGSAFSETISVGARRGMSAVINTADMMRGISKGETQRQAFDAYMALTDEEKRVQDTAMQAYRDTMGANTLATRGAGSGRGALFGQMNDPVQRMALAKLGMGADQMQGVYGQGIAEMGADFRGAGAAGMVRRAAELQRSGMMNAEQYMSNMGQLNAVGGGAGNMETIMKNAVANGMDSSRNIQQMVAGITGLSSESAMMGISTAAGATNAMGLTLDTQALRSLPASMRASAAASQIGKMNQGMTDSSMNLFNVAEMFSLRRAAPGVSDAQLARMQKLTATELAQIQEDPESARKLGLGFLADDKDMLSKISKIITRAQINKSGGLILSQEARAAMNDRRPWETQEEFAARYPELSQEIIAAKGLHGENAAITDPFLSKLGAGQKGAVLDAEGKPIDISGGDNRGPGSDKLNKAEGILATQFKAMEELNTRGQKLFESLYGGLEGFNKKLELSLRDFDPEAYEDQAGKAASGSLQVRGFDGSVSNFSKAVDKFVQSVGSKIENAISPTKTSEQSMRERREEFDRLEGLTPPEIRDYARGGN